MIYSRPTLSSKCVARSGTPRCACRISKRRKRFHAEISRFFVLGAICAIAFPIYSACAQTNSFKQTNLVSDSPGIAANTDPNLNNPWAVAFVPGQPFRIANNKGGNSMVYDRNGVPMGSLGVPAPTWTQHFPPDLPRLEFLRESNRFRGIARRSRRP